MQRDEFKQRTFCRKRLWWICFLLRRRVRLELEFESDRQQQQRMRIDDCERCERQCQQRAFLQLQRCNTVQRRSIVGSERLWRVDECRVRRRVRLESQSNRQQQQRMRIDDCERCERQCQQRAFLQLQRCNTDRGV